MNHQGEGPGTGAMLQNVDNDPWRWVMLAVVSLAMLLSLTSWMTATAIGPELQLKWSLSSSQLGWLTTIVQLGFVVGTGLGAILNLADVLPSRAYFALSAFLAAVSNCSTSFFGWFLRSSASAFFHRIFSRWSISSRYEDGFDLVSVG